MTYSIEQIQEWIKQKQALSWLVGKELLEEMDRLEEENDKLHCMINQMIADQNK